MNYDFEDARKYLSRISENYCYQVPSWECVEEEEKEEKEEEKRVEVDNQKPVVEKEETKMDKKLDNGWARFEEEEEGFFVIDEVHFSSDSEEGMMSREEEFIVMEQASDSDMVIEQIVIPEKED